MAGRRHTGAGGVVALLLLATACSTSGGAPMRSPVPTVAASSSTPSAPPPVPELQRVRRWRDVPWAGDGRPRAAPGAGASLPSVLSDPQGAVLVHHPTERLGDTDGWVGERLFFLGVDGRWRVLEMADLGLPARSWPGPDTYGAGSLSRDGRTWASHFHGGVVLVDLTTGSERRVAFPEGRSNVRYTEWVPGTDVLSAYAQKGRSGYQGFHVDLRGRVTTVGYPAWRTRFDTDGTPIALDRTGRHRLAVQRFADGTKRTSTWTLGLPVPRTTYGVFGRTRMALLAHPGFPSQAPGEVWTLDQDTGAMTARLQVPAATAVVGWTDGDALRLLLADRRLVEWDPRTGELHRVLELPGPYPRPAEWAAATVAMRAQ